MREPSKYQFRLKHILDAIGRLETYASNLSKEELDKMAQLSLTQLSSASSHISSRETK